MRHGRGFAVRPSDEPPDELPDELPDDELLGDGELEGGGVYDGEEPLLGRSCAVDPVVDPAGWE